MNGRAVLTLALACGFAAGWAGADQWDVTTATDNTAASTGNRLSHGTRQNHDVPDQAGATDLDWYVIYSAPRASYEVIVEGSTGDAFPIPTRYTANGSTSLTAADVVDGIGDLAYSLRWRNAGAAVEESRVRVTAVTTGNNTNDDYDIRMYETTIYLARFNNGGSQVTVLLCQNPSAISIAASQYFWSGTGTLLATNNVTIPAKTTSVVAGVGGTVGQSGSVTISHDGPYGSLNCKSVALEPSTGFSFDTPGVYRPI